MHTLLATLGFLASVPHAVAANIEQLGSGSPGIDAMWSMIGSIFPYTNAGSGGLAMILIKIVDIILRLLGGLAVLMVIYAGIKVTTGGDEGLGEAKKILMYSAIGLIAAICADAVVIYVGYVVSGIAG